MKVEVWSCPKCSETIDDGFVVCWRCGTDQHGKEDPQFPSEAEDYDALPSGAKGSRPRRSSWQFSLSTLLIIVSSAAIILGAFRVFPAITRLVIYGGIVGNFFGLALALFVTYVLRIPNDGSLDWKRDKEQDSKGK